jgi:hypothetical protein
MRWRRLNHISDSHNSCVDLIRIHVFQEEIVEARRYEVKSVWILRCCLEIGDELKALRVERQSSGRFIAKDLVM